MQRGDGLLPLPRWSAAGFLFTKTHLATRLPALRASVCVVPAARVMVGSCDMVCDPFCWGWVVMVVVVCIGTKKTLG